MAFFSKLKNLLKGSPKDQVQPEPEAPEAPETAQAPEAVPAQEPTPAQEPAPVPAPEIPAETPATAPAPTPESAPEPGPEPGPEHSKTSSGAPLADWQREMTVALRGAEQRLSAWLDVTIADETQASQTLFKRLAFLFQALEAPKDEAEDFIARFRAWLDDMEYEAVDEFRSELQYRLALALDLEDEEDEQSRLFLKLSDGLAKTKEAITKQIDTLASSHTTMDEAFWEELEEILISADVGFEATLELANRLRARAKKAGTSDPAAFKDLLREELAEIFVTKPSIKAVNPPEVVLMVGVNGAGKTTTIAKLANRAQMQGRKVLVAAGDTFRAAAIEQLEVWAKRVGAGFYARPAKSDPAAVAYEAVDLAVTEQYDLILVDTAGRLQTKVGLMDELGKVRNVLAKRHEGAPHRTVLVLDATTGQNALSQAKLFHEAVGVSEIILTKLDGTAKGGVIVAIAMQFDIPITYVGLGERMEDLRPFDGQDFAKALLGE